MPEMPNTVTGTMPFEAGARSHCSRNQSLRGRAQQCARVAGRTSSARFASSRGSSAARSRSSTRSQRPSAEVELRTETTAKAPVYESPAITACATGFVSGCIDNAMDDIVTELDYFSDDECIASPCSTTTSKTDFFAQVSDAECVLDAAEPCIMEETEEACTSDDEQLDDVSCCDFTSEVCSMASETPSLDDLFVAGCFAKNAVSDDMITEAFDSASQPDSESDQEEAGLLEDSPAFGHEMAFDYASGILGGAMTQASSTWQAQDEAVDEDSLAMESEVGEELAFDYASEILGGAFMQASSSWQEKADAKPSSPATLSLEVLKQKAKESLLKAAQKSQDMQLDSLKQKARDALLKAANAKSVAQAPNIEELRLQVQKAFSKGAQTGELSNALAGAVAEPDLQEIRASLQRTFTDAAASGTLQAALSKLAETQAAQQEDAQIEYAKAKVQQALATGLRNGGLTKALGAAVQQDKWNDLQSKMRQNLSKATASGKLVEALTQVMPKTEVIEQKEQKQNEESTLVNKVQQALSNGVRTGGLTRACGAAVQQDKWKDLQNKMRQNLVKASASGELKGAISQVMQKAEVAAVPPAAVTMNAPLPMLPFSATKLQDAATPSTARSLSSSRSKRRIIGGVVRSPAVQVDMHVPSASPSSSMRKHRSSSKSFAKASPVAFCMDESGGEEDSKVARESSLTRSYDTLGVQFHSLNDDDQIPFAPKISKTKARLHASMSAMSMDLSSSPPARSNSQVNFRETFAPVPLAPSMKMRPSASLGSLGASKMKHSSGGLLPAISLDRKSAESIAWTMQVSKTTSKWGNTGLRGSASMIF